MTDKVLATFRIESEKWESFKALATSNGSNASAILTQFIETCLDTNQLPSQTSATQSPSNNDNHLDKLEEMIDKRIDTRLEELRSQLEKQFLAQLEQLQGKSKAR